MYIYISSWIHNILYIDIHVGADSNRITVNNDHTVLSLACAGGHVAIVKYLLLQGADSGHILKV